MNYKMIINTLGKVLVVIACLLVLPLVLAWCYGDQSWWAIAITIGVGVAIGLPLALCVKPKSTVIFSKEGFVIVSFGWILTAALGALPFVISGAIPSFIDAFFEMCSGFSTTGATILQGHQIEGMEKSLLFWRSFTHWIGGMGVIVFLMVFSTGHGDKRSIHLLRAEMPGQTVDKIVPKARNTAKILYLIYLGMTVLQIVSLLIAGMPFFDSVVATLSTAGTGGFGIKADSIASYNSACQWIIAIFMILFGVNFNVYFLLLIGRFRSALKSRELWIYLGIIAVSAGVITVNVLDQLPYTASTAEAIRMAVFQVASYITTTGSSTIPATSSINNWPMLSKVVLLLLMFIGGCAGSTAGGLKVSRFSMMCCGVRKSLGKALHPHRQSAVKYDGQVLSDQTLQSVSHYFALYMLIFATTFFVLCFDPCAELTIEANLATTTSCLNNVGPSLGVAASGMYMYSPVSKVVLSFVMLIGRLELYPILLAFAPQTWFKR